MLEPLSISAVVFVCPCTVLRAEPVNLYTVDWRVSSTRQRRSTQHCSPPSIYGSIHPSPYNIRGRTNGDPKPKYTLNPTLIFYFQQETRFESASTEKFAPLKSKKKLDCEWNL